MNFQLTSSNDWNEYLADWYKIEINPGWDTLNGVFKSCLSCILLNAKVKICLILRGCRDFTYLEERTNMIFWQKDYSKLFDFNPLMRNAPKWSDTFLKSYSKCCRIFKVCLTILGHYALKGWIRFDSKLI